MWPHKGKSFENTYVCTHLTRDNIDKVGFLMLHAMWPQTTSTGMAENVIFPQLKVVRRISLKSSFIEIFFLGSLYEFEVL